jgi:CheY-like chemotaxis protein
MSPLKILVADDEPVARKVLTAFLEKEKYAVIVAEDGNAALKIMLAADAPPIAILDWMMPGLSGLQVAKGIRSATLKTRPYLMMVSAKTARHDITAALDAGADDYISKPFNPGELMVRLRVARRLVDHQLELQAHIAQLELLAQRYNLLGEIVAAHGAKSRSSTSSAAPAEPSSPTPVAGPTLERIDAIMVRTIGDLGLGKAAVAQIEAPPTHRAAAFTSWAGLVFTKEQVWVDLLLEVDQQAAAIMFQRMLKRVPGSVRETLDFLAETHTIFSAAFKADFQAKGVEIITPILSRALRTGEAHHRVLPVPAERETRTYALPGFAIRLTIVRHPGCVEMKTAGQLGEQDILAEPFPPPEVSDLPLLSQGVILSERFIEKLSALAESELKTLLVPVFQVTPLAAYFLKDEDGAPA